MLSMHLQIIIGWFTDGQATISYYSFNKKTWLFIALKDNPLNLITGESCTLDELCWPLHRLGYQCRQRTSESGARQIVPIVFFLNPISGTSWQNLFWELTGVEPVHWTFLWKQLNQLASNLFRGLTISASQNLFRRHRTSFGNQLAKNLFMEPTGFESVYGTNWRHRTSFGN